MTRHLRAFFLLPFNVTTVIPCVLLLVFRNVDTRWDTRSLEYAVPWLGALLLLLLGTFLFAVTVYLFISEGRGTLAPWDPTQQLVTAGPYRFVRNPMISGVLMILVAEALLLGSLVLLAWALTFFAINHVYFLLSEEPKLAKRFGNEYVRYCERVPRWLPRFSSFNGERTPREPAH